MALKINSLIAYSPMMTLQSPKFSRASTLHPSSTKNSRNGDRATIRISPEKLEIFKSMEGWARENILTLLKPVEKSWQPQEFLPDPTSDEFFQQINAIREGTKEIPDDYFVVLVGDMITEEALPTYHLTLGSTYGFQNEIGIENETPWAIWSRGWTAEENRHGDLLNKYLYLSGRVNMIQIEKTIQYLIRSGMEVGMDRNPYLTAIYTSFQERATFISHGNTAKLAMQHGDTKLAQICGTIASDEKRHEIAYTKIVHKLFELDPNGTMLAFTHMMRRKISMPAHLIFDGRDDNLFAHFSSVASRIGVYTASDYIDILEHLVEKWNVAKVTGLTSEGREAQDYVCGLGQRLGRMEERAQGLKAKKASCNNNVVPFSWIFDRKVEL